MIDTPKECLARVLERMDQAARRAGRSPNDVALVAVTKRVPFEKVLPYLQAGVRDIGENRVQEALEKCSEFRALSSQRPKLHLIGPLQTNKAKKAVEFFDMVQSLDRWDLAEDLNRHVGGLGKILECLVQVKISDELTKSGLDPAALPEFLPRLRALPNLRIRGLMGIPPLRATGDAARPYFSQLRKLFEDVPSNVRRPTSDLGPRTSFDVLSMGMSSDFEIAIEEGSTMVRIGSALFGGALDPH